MKAILMSIRPRHSSNIMNLFKTLELRTKIPTQVLEDIKNGVIDGIWVYVYVSKGKQDLYYNGTEKDYVLCDGKSNITYYDSDFQKAMMSKLLNGTIPFRFWFDEYEVIKWHVADWSRIGWEGYFISDKMLKNLCLTDEQVLDYGNGKTLYAWRIKKLEIFDKPMQLSDFRTIGKSKIIGHDLKSVWKPLKRAPQSYQYVWVNDNVR